MSDGTPVAGFHTNLHERIALLRIGAAGRKGVGLHLLLVPLPCIGLALRHVVAQDRLAPFKPAFSRMFIRQFLSCCLLTALFGSGSAALAQPQVVDLPEGRCTLQEVIDRLMFQSIERRGQIAQQTMPVLEKLKDVNSKASNNEKSVGEQLSPTDIEKFSRYSQQIQTMQLASLMESRRMRDLQAIKQMAILADQEYRWGKRPKEGTNDAVYHAAYQLIILSSPKLELTEPKTKQCTLEYALHKQTAEPLAKIEPLLPRVQVASSYYKSLAAKYKMDRIDRSKLTVDERLKFDDYEVNFYSPFRKNYSYIKEIQAIKIIAAASELMHQANLQDISMGGGSIDNIGNTIRRNAQNKSYDEPTLLAIGVWNKINEKIPSEDVKEFSTRPNN